MTNTSTSIRYKNTRHLVELAGGVSEFAERLGKSQSQTSQFAGSTPIKGIGNKIARQIEGAFEKPEGWLDVTHTDLDESKNSSQSNSLNKLVSDLQELNAKQMLSEEAIQILQSTVTLLSKNRKQPQIDTDEVERVNRLFDDAE